MGEVVRAATILVVERVGQSQLIWTPVLTKPRIFKLLIRIINTFPLHKPLRLVSISRKKKNISLHESAKKGSSFSLCNTQQNISQFLLRSFVKCFSQ